MKLYNKESLIRWVIGTIFVSVIGFAGTVYTARSQASSKVDEDLQRFKEATIGDIGNINGKLEGMDKRLETMQGSLNTITSVLLKK